MRITCMKLLKKLKSIIKKYYLVNRDFIIRDIFRRHTLPSFLIIGVQKAGTSALSYYMSQNPKLEISYGKEVQFFN